MKQAFIFVFAIFLFPFFTNVSIAQNNNSKDLSKQANTKKQIDYFFKKAKSISLSAQTYKRDSTLWYTEQALKSMYKTQEHDSLYVKKYFNAANYAARVEAPMKNATINDYKHTIRYLDSAIAIGDRVNYRREHYKVYSIYAAIYQRFNDYNKVIHYYKKIITLCKEKNDQVNLMVAYDTLADIYEKLEQENLSKQMRQLSLIPVDSTSKSAKRWKYIYHFQLAENMIYMSEKKAEETLVELESYFKSIDQPSGIVHSYIILGNLYLHNKEFAKALELYEKARSTYHLDFGKRSFDLLFANLYATQGNYEKAKTYFDSFTKNNDPYIDPSIKKIFTIDYYKLGGNIYMQTKEYKSASDYLFLYAEQRSNLLKQKEAGLLEEFAVKFETEQKEKELAIAALAIEKGKKNQVLIISIFAFVLLTVTVLFLFYQKRRKYKLSLLEKEIEINNQRTVFFENVFHEIRTPMTIIGGYLNLINKNTLKPNLVAKYSEIGLRNCHEVTASSNDFLALIKSEKAQQQIYTNQQVLIDFIKQLLSKYKENMYLKQISLVHTTNIKNDITLKLDYDKIEKILNNLMMNAIKYSPGNTKITFTSIIEKQHLIFKVQDEGYGIPEEEQAYIFDRFYQASSNKLISGVGIGLSLVKNFTELLGGQIDIKSNSGEGSLFVITLPIEEENISDFVKETSASDIISIEGSIEEQRKNTNLPNLLLVEDNFEMTLYLEELLKPFYNVDVSLSVDNALEKIQMSMYDVIVSDLRMPKVDGHEFKEILNSTTHKDTPFIMITASTLSENKKKGLAMGINDYLIKPFQDIELITRIKVLLSNKELQMQYIKESVLEKEESTANTNVDTVVKLANDAITKNLSDETFSVSKLAEKCNYSTRQFTRIIKKSTGLSPNKLILEVRLLTAYEMIVNRKEKRIKRIMFDIGINSYGYFNKVFSERFGLKPSELIDRE
ncbi:ATP-binding protein [Kordia sp.]|uniref:ATP-binding protein n=1 Tax=Kordia sp. TaxID=1965332 RepID=UPI003D6BCBD0